MRGRVAVGVCACGERVLNELGGAINRGADGEVYGSAGVFSRDGTVGGERLPGVFRVGLCRMRAWFSFTGGGL